MAISNKPESSSYEQIIKLVNKHFKPIISLFAAHYKFRNAQMQVGVRNLTVHCEFEDKTLETNLWTRFIIGFLPDEIQDRLLEEKKTVTFNQVVEIARETARVSTSYETMQAKNESGLHHSRKKSTNSTHHQQRKCLVCGKCNHDSDQ